LKDCCCMLFDDPRRPKVCSSYQPSKELCGQSRAEAIKLIRHWEKETTPKEK
jgi:hypothetical protein